MEENIFSMTGYGLAQVEKDGDEIKVEMRSVNSRFLDFNIRMPRIFFSQELRLKNLLQERISRGKVDIYVNLRASKFLKRDLFIDYPLIEQLGKLVEDGRLPLEEKFTLGDLLSIDGALVFEDKKSDVLETMLEEAFSEALDGLVEARRREGRGLKAHLLQLADSFESILEEIASKAPQWKKSYREAFTRRLEELILDKNLVDKDRLEFELALFSDKKDIEEEVNRSFTHIKAFREDLEREGPHGRKLDFLAQELGREINTMGSKAAEYELTRYVIEGKALLEQIREQLQNLE